MNTLNEIYEVLREEGFCSTQADFSEEWLGRSAHYMSQTGGNARRASLTSLQLLAAQLKLALREISASEGMRRYYRMRSAAVAASTIFRASMRRGMCPDNFGLLRSINNDGPIPLW